MSNPLKAALYSKLTGDSTLTNQLTSGTAVWESVAPQETDAPYVVFSQQSGRDAYTMGDRAWTDYRYLVKGVTQGNSSRAAGSIAARIDTVLTDGALTVTGGTAFYMRRETTVDFPETDRGTTYRHAGGVYRIYLQET